MSNFKKVIHFETEFEQDKVSLDLTSLKRKDMLALGPYMPNPGETSGTLQSMEIMDVAAELLPKYVMNFNGVKDADGNDMTIEEVVEETYFMELVSEIVSKLFEASKMGSGEAKN